MANTFSPIYLQFVFAVKNRQSLIAKEHKKELHKYVTGLTRNLKPKMLAVHCMPHHIHVFVGFKPVISIPDFVKEIKVESNEFINDKKVKGNFGRQEGYGVFSYSHSHIDAVVKYILHQENIIKRKHLNRNIINCWKNLKVLLKKNIYRFFRITGREGF